MTVEWNGQQFEKEVYALLAKNMSAATLYLKGQVQKALNRGGGKRGQRSKPGEPPRKQTARLFRSITTAVIINGDEIRGVVGTNVPYAARLEYGFVGKDSLGRNYQQQPRPYLRPTLEKYKQGAWDILVGRSTSKAK